jgi:sugar porter (SP) family MFS transporter
MDRFGRKGTIQIGAAIATVGGILQCSAMNLAMILVGRIVSGWAIGLMSMSVPVYLAECAHPNVRGMIVGITQQMIGVGFIVSTWVGYGSRHTPDSSSFQWRFPLAFQIIPSALLLVGLIWLPESPRHLIEKDRDDAAMKILRKLHYDGHNDEWIQNEYNEIRATLSAERAITAPGWAVMFKVPAWRKRLLLGVLIQVFTQLTGISELMSLSSRLHTGTNIDITDVIGYYQTIMYEALGIKGHRALLVAGIYNCVGPIANLIFIFFILDRVGRKKPLLIGAFCITLALFAEAGLNAANPNGTRQGYSIGGVFFLFLVSVIFSLSFGPISWVYMSEIMPMQIRGRGCAFATGIGNWLVSTFFAQISPIALGKIGWVSVVGMSNGATAG